MRGTRSLILKVKLIAMGQQSMEFALTFVQKPYLCALYSTHCFGVTRLSSFAI
jgi:hypothetical protein